MTPHSFKTRLALAIVAAASGQIAAADLAYAPAPVDNPLKGLVPYAGQGLQRFPQSLEFRYFPLADLMTGPESFTWEPLEVFLNQVSGRGNQAVFRVYLEFPGKPNAVPGFLSAAGVKVTEWVTNNTYVGRSFTPDYADPRLRQAISRFIAALGARYDGDPRVGFITAGMLGSWGEWHTWPRTDLWAPKQTQIEVMDAFEKAFRTTPILLRYPAGPDRPDKADNSTRNFGYHDDSFAWATLATGRPQDGWFFEALMRSAGATDRWRTRPIGGEIRPEVWGAVFDEPSAAPKGQEFLPCVERTHATWLMDTGMFREDPSPARRRRAEEQVRRLGYEFHVAQAELRVTAERRLHVSLTVRNLGVAPFYYDWPLELVLLTGDPQQRTSWQPPWHLTGILPGQPDTAWSWETPAVELPAGTARLLLRAPHPLPNGKPLRFANQAQDADLPGYLTLGTVVR